MINMIDVDILDKMANPSIVFQMVNTGLSNADEDVQDRALELLTVLIGRFHFEHKDYYKMLYNTIRMRKSLSLRILKILEISLKSRKLSMTAVIPFLKLFLRRSLFSEFKEVCWMLGLIINLMKR